MGNQRRMFLHKRVYFVTNRVARGLPFVPNKAMNYLLYGTITRAWHLFPSITVCGFVFMGNHYHMLLVTDGDPQDVSSFMHFVNGELGKAVNRLLGRRNSNVWASRYTPAILLDPPAVMEKMAYLYANPVLANLVATAESWFGCGTFRRALEDFRIEGKFVKPSDLYALARADFTKSAVTELLSYFEKLPGIKLELPIRPLAWLECFPNYDLEPDKVRANVLRRIREIESEEENKRRKENRSLPDKKMLSLQNPHKHYSPKKYSRKVVCISTINELRMDFIELYQDFCSRCKDAYQKWKNADYSFPMPAGAFLPPQRPKADIVYLPV
jgi:REP element-mobilizing transposase RayT